jgi:LSD1 subclass zinc finger protein
MANIVMLLLVHSNCRDNKYHLVRKKKRPISFPLVSRKSMNGTPSFERLNTEGGPYFYRSFDISMTAILGVKELEIAGHRNVVASDSRKGEFLRQPSSTFRGAFKSAAYRLNRITASHGQICRACRALPPLTRGARQIRHGGKCSKFI